MKNILRLQTTLDILPNFSSPYFDATEQSSASSVVIKMQHDTNDYEETKVLQEESVPLDTVVKSKKLKQ